MLAIPEKKYTWSRRSRAIVSSVGWNKHKDNGMYKLAFSSQTIAQREKKLKVIWWYKKKIWVTSSGGPLVHWSAHTQLETCLHYFALSLNLIFMHGGHVGILKFAREIIGWPGCVRSPQSANPEYRKKRFVAFKVVYISFIFISNFSILFCLLLKSNIVLSSKFEYFLSLKHFISNLTSVSSPSPRKKR